jgi:hypothetical protein
MKNNKNVIYLIEKGLSEKTVANLSESQIKLLVEKFKKENKEQTEVRTTVYDTKDPEQKKKLNQALQDPTALQGQNIQVKETEMTEDETDDVTSSNALGKDAEQTYTGQEAPHDANDMADDGMDDDSSDNRSMMGMAESTLNEKFESKAQQGLFWARCNKCSSKNCKWCKMAKEFSDSTSKKQYKKMPEKKHPEKTVKVKGNTNEGLQKFLEKKIIDMVESNINPKMTKKDLIEAIKKKSKKTPKSDSMIIRRPKKLTMFSDEAPMDLPIGKMFSIGKK